MKWTKKANQLHSDCGQYIIRNNGKPGGESYCLYRYDPQYGCYCNLARMGKLDELKSWAEGDD